MFPEPLPEMLKDSGHKTGEAVGLHIAAKLGSSALCMRSLTDA
jgi:hypothetical protein